MKRLISLLLALTFCFALSACGDKTNTSTESENEEMIDGVPSPMIEITQEEFEETIGHVAFYPDDATDAVYYKINGDTGIFEMSFLYNESEFTFRYAKNDEQDISGFYYSWDVEETNENYTIHFNSSSSLGFISWYKDGANYCLDATDVTLEELKDMGDKCYAFLNDN